MSARYFVGVTATGRMAFRCDASPTCASHPEYLSVIGPYKTRRAALWSAGPGANNPRNRSVNDAERISKGIADGVLAPAPADQAQAQR